MPGVVKHLPGHADFHDVPGVHHRHPVRHIGDHAQIVGDINGGQGVFTHQIADQVQNLRLDGHVQGGGGLVANQDFRVAGYGDSDDHTLAHAAGKLVGILLCPAFGLGDAHVRQRFDHALVGRRAGQALMQLQCFLDLRADGFQRVQAGHGVLEHHGDFPAPDGQPFLFGFIFRQILAVVEDAAAVDPAVGVQQAHKGFRQHRFAGAALPHDRQRFPLE